MSIPRMILYLSLGYNAKDIFISLVELLLDPKIAVVFRRAVCHGAPLTPPTFKLVATTFVKPSCTRLQNCAHPVVIKES